MKSKTKFIPVQLFDMAGLEAWLSSMAEQGMYLEKLSQNRARFRHGPPRRGVRYALDITGWSDIDNERNENYAQMGWRYVTTLVGLYYVYQSDSPEAPPLHTDPVTQSETLAPLIRRLIRSSVLSLFLLLFGFRDSLAALYADPWSLPRFVLLRTEYALLLALVLLPAVFLLFIPQLRQLRALRKLRRQLAAGIPLDRERRWPRFLPPIAFDLGIFVLLALALTARLCLEPRLGRTLTDIEDLDLPHLTLSQAVGEGGDFRVIPESPYDRMLRTNTVFSSLLTPEQLVWQEGGRVLSPEFTGEAFVSVSYYRVRFPRTAPVLLEGLSAEYRRRLSALQRQQDGLVVHTTFTIKQEFQPVSGSDFQELQLMEYQIDDGPATRCYVGRMGVQVFRLVCRGIPDPDRCLTLLSGQMERRSGDSAIQNPRTS